MTEIAKTHATSDDNNPSPEFDVASERRREARQLQKGVSVCSFILLVIAFLVVLAREARAEDTANQRAWEQRISTVIMGWPRHATDENESWPARKARADEAAHAIFFASGFEPHEMDVEDAAALLTIMFFESRFARYVWEDRCADGPRKKLECDGGKSLGVFQLGRAWQSKMNELRLDGFRRLTAEAVTALLATRDNERRCGKALDGYRGRCGDPQLGMRERARDVFFDVLVNGWPEAPIGYSRDPRPSPALRREMNRLCQGAPIGEFHESSGLSGWLVEYHFSEARGWHKGCSAFKIGSEVL